MASPKKKPPFSLTEDELAIIDTTANRMRILRSEVVSNLILYHVLCGGDFPLTSRILSLKPVDRDRIVAEIRAKFESDNPPKPQAFRVWVKEILGSADSATISHGAETLLQALLR